MRVNRKVVALVAVVAGSGAAASPAAALEPGVTVSPTSPAGKEYSFPLDVQRGAAVGHNAPQGVPEPMFGVGIAPASATAGNAARSSAPGSATGKVGKSNESSTSASSKPTGKRGAAARRHSAQVSRLQAAELQTLTRPGSTWTGTALITLAVVLGGLLVGAAAMLASRRRRT